MRWNLSSIYENAKCQLFNDDVWKLRMSKADFGLARILLEREGECNNYEYIKNLFDRISEEYELCDKLENYIDLSLMINATDADAKLAKGVLYEAKNVIDIITLDLASLLTENPKLFDSDIISEKYKGYILELKHLAKFPISLQNAVNTMSITGSKAWRSFYAERLEYVQKQSGLRLGLLQAGIRTGSQDYASQCNLDTQKLSKLAAEDAYPALVNIKLEFQNRCQLYKHHYYTPIDYMLDKYRIPNSIKYSYIIEARQLGRSSVNQYIELKNCSSIKPFELDRFDNISCNMSYDECIEIVRKCFASRSDILSDMVEEAVLEQLIDNEPREGKRAGACITTIHSLKRSFILSNDVGGIRAIISLAHEMGHNFHHKMMFRHPIVETRSPMVINEFISKFFELWIVDYMEDVGIITESEAIEINLKSNIRTFCHTMAMFDFEKSFFLALKHGNPDISETSKLLSDAFIKNYWGKIDEEAMNPYEWSIKPHFYYTDIAYYNFPYAIGQVLAMKLFSQFKSGDLTVDNLGAALSESGRLRSFEDFINMLKNPTQTKAAK